MTMETIVTDLSALASDDARDVVNAAQIVLRGQQQEIRDLCKPWDVQLRVQKRYRRMGIIKREIQRSSCRCYSERCN